LRSESLVSPYVCAFRGRRDSYQVPLALAETGQLDQFITDLYRTDVLNRISLLLPERIQGRVSSRHQAGIPDDRVRCLWATTALEHARHFIGLSHRRTYALLDQRYSLAARDRARKTKTDLLLYSPYAWEAFTAHYSHAPRRVLFQFHPHSDFERRILTEDFKTNPEVASSHVEETSASSGEMAIRERDCWKHADLIICASSFTKRTLIEAGADAAVCEVIPYGVELPQMTKSDLPSNVFEVLFVGSGVQRKGLHHLVRAWTSAKLPPNSRLTLLCRNIDPGIAKLVSDARSIRLLPAASGEQLSRLYGGSSLFVMPSLIEGFGQVFLEALAFGCPVLGTPHSCLPDLGAEEDGIFNCEPGNVPLLTEMLERLASTLPGNLTMRQQARACAGRFTWSRFRADLVRLL
jgi:glycosyltransferase involved in cell wall biosynthesis